eukprot:SAG11_NODE_206_length_12389_cov_11.831192_7_plen_184_part_00
MVVTSVSKFIIYILPGPTKFSRPTFISTPEEYIYLLNSLMKLVKTTHHTFHPTSRKVIRGVCEQVFVDQVDDGAVCSQCRQPSMDLTGMKSFWRREAPHATAVRAVRRYSLVLPMRYRILDGRSSTPCTTRHYLSIRYKISPGQARLRARPRASLPSHTLRGRPALAYDGSIYIYILQQTCSR